MRNFRLGNYDIGIRSNFIKIGCKEFHVEDIEEFYGWWYLSDLSEYRFHLRDVEEFTTFLIYREREELHSICRTCGKVDTGAGSKYKKWGKRTGNTLTYDNDEKITIKDEELDKLFELLSMFYGNED